MWLECIGVVIIIITFPYSTCINSFFGSSIPISLLILKMFFILVYVIFVKYIAKLAQRIFEIIQISTSANNIIISVIQRINGAEPERALGSTAKSCIQTAVSATSARYWPEI